MRTQSEINKLFPAQIRNSLASDFVRGWRQFLNQSQSGAKQNQSHPGFFRQPLGNFSNIGLLKA